jgi:citrate synthase
MYSETEATLSAAEAARLLGVTPATLYAYVSRGLIRSERGSGRTRRYAAADIAALRHGGLPSGPVVATAITLRHGGRLFFRGREAAGLARTLSVREAAALIWDCDPAWSFGADNVPEARPELDAVRAALATASPLSRMLAMLQLAVAAEPRWPHAGAAAFGYAGARLLRFLAAAAAGRTPSARPIEAVLAEAWGFDRDARPVLRAALILAADDGVDAAAVAARVAAAAGLPPWRSVAAGLASLDFDGTDRSDGRADALLAMLPRPTGGSCTLTQAIARLGESFGFPPGGAAALYAIGRTIGLVAHVAEERAAKRPLRARGAYVGVTPAPAPIPQSGRG